jgi:hypothetical protein
VIKTLSLSYSDYTQATIMPPVTDFVHFALSGSDILFLSKDLLVFGDEVVPCNLNCSFEYKEGVIYTRYGCYRVQWEVGQILKV